MAATAQRNEATRENLVAKLSYLNEEYERAKTRCDRIACFIIASHIDVTKEMIKELDRQ